VRGTLRPPALLVFALALVVVEVDGVQGHDVLEQLLPVHQVVHTQRQQSSASTSPDASAFVLLPSMEEGPRKRGDEYLLSSSMIWAPSICLERKFSRYSAMPLLSSHSCTSATVQLTGSADWIRT
jgi:hypothetical protein